jgi:hypothetical protein
METSLKVQTFFMMDENFLCEVEKEFGAAAQLAARVGGPLLLWTSRREEKRLAAAKTYEPPTFLERRNWEVSPEL